MGKNGRRRRRQAQDDRDAVLRGSAAINATRTALRQASATRDGDPAAWRDAARAHRAAINALYTPEFDRALDAVRHGDRFAIDDAITFLEADPWCYRSGYVKQTIMERLHGEHLSAFQRQRLHDVLLRHVDQPTRREFRVSCRLARQLDSADLRRALHERIASGDAARCRRALWMLTGLRRPRFTRAEVLIVRDLLLADLDEDSWWNQEGWIVEQARNVADAEWIDHVYAVATGHGHGAVAAARLLPHLLTSPSLEQRHALAQRVLDVVDCGGDETWFEALTVTADTPALRNELERRRDHPDPDTMRRARWSLSALGLPNGW